MSENIEINEGNCVLNNLDEVNLNELFENYKMNILNRCKKQDVEILDILLKKIDMLNMLVKKLHGRNLSVETIVKCHDLGKQIQEKLKTT